MWKATAWNRPGSDLHSSSPEPVSNIQSHMTLQNWKTTCKPSQHADSRGVADVSLTLTHRKEARQRNRPPVNQHSKNKLQSRTAGRLQSWSPEPEDKPHLTESCWLSSCCWKTEEKLARLLNHLERLRQILCLNTNNGTGCWRSNTRTTKTEILLFLKLQVFCVFVCLFVLSLVCLFMFVHLSSLTSLFFCLSVLFVFVLLVLLLWVN
jgi:hypothetical protein